MLQVRSLSFDYLEQPLLSGVQFSLNSGKLLHLRGGNGVGKTTLLRLLAGLLQPSEGEIRWNNQSINDDLSLYQRTLCYVGHKTGLSPQLTVKENCYFDLHWQRRNNSFSELLERFDLKNLANKPCYQLSQGQQRRVGLLRIAMTDARLWLLDEPLVALDKPAITILTACLNQHLAENGLIVMTSHQSLVGNFHDYEEYTL